jgi:tetratricopeptide (TPR) repeat protein
MWKERVMRRSSSAAAFGTLLCLAGLAAGPAAAADIDYDARRAAALRRCDEPAHRGRVDQARDCYGALLRNADLLVRAEAMFALGDLRGANDAFRAAVTADPRAVLPRIRWARMFLAAGVYGEALPLLQEVLEQDEQDAGARLAMARLELERFEGEAAADIAALIEDDSNLIEAHLLAASIAIERGQYEQAVRAATRARELAGEQRLPPLEALTLLAAVEVMRNRDPATLVRETLDYNPRYGGLFETLGRFEVMRRRYREADTYLQRAAEVQPELWSARRELGLNLMRLGRIEEARGHLVASYEGDPFNVVTSNTLRLIDSLDNYDFIRLDDPALVLQLHKGESAALRPYVEQIARDSISSFSRRYGYTPDGPITIELYRDHGDFEVRTAGLTGIGLLGVTFGHLVAMDSPAGQRRGEFHWGSVLWHEMAHVFTLSATDHRVPRWLSEGLSVYEEWTSGPTPGLAATTRTLDVFRDGKFLPVASIDDGFMRPTYEGQVQVSYDQAGLMCLFAAERFGFNRVAQLLRLFRDPAMVTATAIRTAFQVSPEEFDAQFKAFMEQRFAAYLKDPERWPELMRRAHTMLESRNWREAREAAQAAITMLPEYTASGSAYEVLAAAEEGAGNSAAAIAAWQAWRKAGGWDPEGMRKLGELLLAASRNAEAADVLAAVNWSDPLALEGHDRLGGLLIEQQRGAEALREYEVLLALKPLDTAAANFGMARALSLTGDEARARRHLLKSLETAPNYRPAQRLLLEMTGERTR